MKKIIITLAIVLLASFVSAETVFEAVTPDNKEADIGKVKVRESEVIPEETLAILKAYNQDYQVPAAKMHRLELIDAEIAELEAKIDALIKEKVAKQLLRDTVKAVAEKVALLDEDPENIE